MIAVHFKKAYAERVLETLQTGKPIPPMDDSGWTGHSMLTLAGILYAGVMSQGPHEHQRLGLTFADHLKQHPERREAVTATFMRDIHDGIEFTSQLALAVADDNYDDRLEPEVGAVVYETADGQKKLIPVKGFK
jgi:hypothetical protein